MTEYNAADMVVILKAIQELNNGLKYLDERIIALERSPYAKLWNCNHCGVTNDTRPYCYNCGKDGGNY